MNAAATAVSGTDIDLALTPGAGGVRKWINTKGVEAKLTKALKRCGLLTAEIEAA
jgi:hypothetical protein